MLVFKQWIYPANRKSYSRANAGMLKYIATRDGVEEGSLSLNKEINKNMAEYIATRENVATHHNQTHGLFGKMCTDRYMKDLNLQDTQKHLDEVSNSGKTVYNAVISLTEEEAGKKDMLTKRAFAEFVKNNMYTVAREMGIKPRTLEWCAAAHLEKGHPHVHIMYWDSEQAVGVSFIHPEKANGIRKKLTSSLYREELQEIYKEKDGNKKVFMQGLKSLLGEEQDIASLAKEKAYTNVLLNRRIKCPELLSATEKLYANIQRYYSRGGLKYKYLPPIIKNELDELSKKILNLHPQISKEYVKFLLLTRQQAEFFGGDDNVKTAVSKADVALRKQIANTILNVLRECKELQKEGHSKAYGSTASPSVLPAGTFVTMLQRILNDVTKQNHVAKNRSDSYTPYDRLSQIDKDRRKREMQLGE